MHTVRNRTAMSRNGGEFRHLATASGKQAVTSPAASPVFPKQVNIAPRKGAIIRDVPLPEPLGLPDPQAMAEAALILPAPARPAAQPAAPPASRIVPKRGQKTRRKPAAARTRNGQPKRTKRKQTKGTDIKIRDTATLAAAKALAGGLADQNTGPISDLIAGPVIGPLAGLPRGVSLVAARGPGIAARVVRWLDAISLALLGQPLARSKKKRRLAALPAPRQSLARTTEGRRAPPSRQPITPSGGAGDELARLRAENARLKAELARLAT